MQPFIGTDAMERLQTSLDKVHRYAFYLFSFTIPLNQFISTRILLGVVAISLFTFRRANGFAIRNLWDVILYILVLIVGLAYSTDIITGLRVLETSFPFLALPVAAGALLSWKSTEIRSCFRFFVWGTFLACIICLVNAVLASQTGLKEDIFAYNFTSLLGFQPIYFAYFLIFGITYSLFVLYYKDSAFGVSTGILVCSVMFLSLLLTGTKTSFICLLLVFSFFILKTLVEDRNRVRWLTTLFIAVMLACMFIVSLVDINNWNASSDAWERLALWESAFNAVPNIIWGVGTGDYKIVLNEYYTSHQLIEFAEDGMNAHNQLIQILFSNGVLGLISFVLMVAHPIYRSVRSGNMFALVSLFPFVIYGITEVFLGRYQGVVFWVWMHQTFLNLIIVEEPKIITSAIR